MPKYLVQKEGLILPSGTYFVLRSSDVFAPAGLHAYAAVINTVLETEAALKHNSFTPQERARLDNLADIIATTAVTWAHMSESKIPD